MPFNIKISSLQNPLVKHVARVRESSSYRKSTRSVLVTGYKIILELMEITIPKKVFFSRDISFPECPSEKIYVTDAVLKKMTNLPSNEGICAEFPLPAESSLAPSNKILVLDQIKDPGNAGTLMRTAIAFGWDGLFLLPGSVDPFNEKVFRASRGALFKLPWRQGSWQELNQLKEEKCLACYLADLHGELVAEKKREEKLALLLSNESAGVSPEAQAFGQKITIPMSSQMESLNVAVAGAILMYELI